MLVNGASGGVGTFAVQIAKALGAAHVTAVCSTRNVETAARIGADRVVDYTQEDHSRSGERYDLVFDNAGVWPLRSCSRMLTDGGSYVMVTSPKTRWLHPLPRMIANPLYFALAPGRSPGFKVAARNTADLEQLRDLVEQGLVQPVMERRFTLDEAAEAVRAPGRVPRARQVGGRSLTTWSADRGPSVTETPQPSIAGRGRGARATSLEPCNIPRNPLWIRGSEPGPVSVVDGWLVPCPPPRGSLGAAATRWSDELGAVDPIYLTTSEKQELLVEAGPPARARVAGDRDEGAGCRATMLPRRPVTAPPRPGWQTKTRDSHGAVRGHAKLAVALRDSLDPGVQAAFAAGEGHLAQVRVIDKALHRTASGPGRDLIAKAEALPPPPRPHTWVLASWRSWVDRVLEYVAPDIADTGRVPAAPRPGTPRRCGDPADSAAPRRRVHRPPRSHPRPRRQPAPHLPGRLHRPPPPPPTPRPQITPPPPPDEFANLPVPANRASGSSPSSNGSSRPTCPATAARPPPWPC